MSEPTMVDQLAEDTKAADAPPEYPEGAPKFHLLMRLPYRRRAVAMRLYSELQAFLRAHPEMQKNVDKAEQQATDEQDVDPAETVEVDLAVAADSYDLVAALDDVLASVAVDPGEYEAWEDRYDIDVFMQTWAAWQAASQPGEASSSSS